MIPRTVCSARGPRHRLDAEVIRDMLRCGRADLLDQDECGRRRRQAIPTCRHVAGAWPTLRATRRSIERDKGERLYRRSLYVYWKRTSPHPMMTLFDAPSRESRAASVAFSNQYVSAVAGIVERDAARGDGSRVRREVLMTEFETVTTHGSTSLLFTLLACRDA